MRPGLPLRVSIVFAILVAPSCSAPSIPAPWEASEPQALEPSGHAPLIIPTATWKRIGASIRGKQLQACTVGTGTKRIYIIGGIHGDEAEGPIVAESLPDALLSSPDFVHSTVRIVKDMNPDGTSAKTRGNTRKVDLERNWPSKDFQRDSRPGGGGERACSELETAAVHADLVAFKPDIVIVFQSANLPPSVSFQGPGRTLAYDFVVAARRADPKWHFNPEQRNRPPGSIESLVGADMGKTVLRVEYQRSRAADLNSAAALAGVLAIDQRPIDTAAR